MEKCVSQELRKERKKSYGGPYQNKKAAEKDIYYLRNGFFTITKQIK